MFKIQNAIIKCNDSGIRTLLSQINKYEAYFYLIESTKEDFNKFIQSYPNISKKIKNWFEICNGGYLFDTLLLSTIDMDQENCIRLARLGAFNKDIVYNSIKLSNNYLIFAISSFGDVYCIDKNGDDEIIQWSVSENKIIYRWSDFAFWLKQEFNTAIELINEHYLTPLVINEGSIL